MTHQLYDFQEETIFHLQNSQYKRECVCINTGGGKTFLFAAFAMMELSEGRKSLILVPRIELLQQAFDEFKMNFGYEPKLIEAGYRCAPQESHGVYIAMVETLYRRNALVKQLQKEITNLIVDE
jgi:superfamily II DNA or RNA helicase